METETEIEFIPDFSLDDPENRSIEDLVNKALNEDPDEQWEKTKKAQRGIIVDIDGTLANVRSGVSVNKKGELDWDLFFAGIPTYPVFGYAQRLVQIYYQMGFVIHIVTARPARYQEATEDWLAKQSIPYDFLYMRGPDDRRKDDVVKQEILKREFPDKSLIEFVLDDRPSVVEMWRKNGLTCLQCNHDFIS